VLQAHLLLLLFVFIKNKFLVDQLALAEDSPDIT
jgi:hypothetical protein